MLKKIISLTLSFVLVLAFTGCGAKKDTKTSSAASSVTSTAASLAASFAASSTDAASETSSSTDAASGGTGVISEDKLFPLTTDGIEFKSFKLGTLQDLIDSFPGSLSDAGDNLIQPGGGCTRVSFSLPNTNHALFLLELKNKTQEDQKPQQCAIETIELLSKDSEFPCGVKYMYAADGSTSLGDVLKTFGNPKETKNKNLYCTTWDIGNGGASVSFYFSNDKDTPDNEILTCVFNNIDELG